MKDINALRHTRSSLFILRGRSSSLLEVNSSMEAKLLDHRILYDTLTSMIGDPADLVLDIVLLRQ